MLWRASRNKSLLKKILYTCISFYTPNQQPGSQQITTALGHCWEDKRLSKQGPAACRLRLVCHCPVPHRMMLTAIFSHKNCLVHLLLDQVCISSKPESQSPWISQMKEETTSKFLTASPMSSHSFSHYLFIVCSWKTCVGKARTPEARVLALQQLINHHSSWKLTAPHAHLLKGSDSPWHQQQCWQLIEFRS